MRSFILLGILCMLLVDVAVSLNQRDCKCRIKSKKRIIGGREADPMSFPWVVSVQWMESDPVPDHLRRMVPEKTKLKLHFCGGNILNERWVLTAAHCVHDENADDLQVAYGDNDLVKMYERKLFSEVEKLIVHPGYAFLTNDIALIKLKTPLTFNKTVQPACLPALPADIYDGVLKITGFGGVTKIIIDEKDNRSGGEISRYLREGNTYDLSNESRMKCRKKNNICVENLVDPSADITCKGDSGGPLHHTKGGRSTVIGLTSFGDIERRGNKRVLCVGRDYFTRVSSHMDWIKEHISSDQICV